MTDTTPAVDLSEAEAEVDLPEIGARDRYNALMQVIRNRVTVRKFDPDFVVPDAHFELILEAARHGPSGANAQPWQFIVVRDPGCFELGCGFDGRATIEHVANALAYPLHRVLHTGRCVTESACRRQWC